MTMDIKDIIKWFIPCFHILLKQNLDKKWIFLSLFLLFNFVSSSKINSELVVSENVDDKLDSTKNGSVSYDGVKYLSQSAGFAEENINLEKPKALGDASGARTMGRTFGRPFFKKIMAGVIPVVFQVGAASTWAVVAALVGVKTLIMTMIILKLLLIAGAAKIGAIFGSKGHTQHGWEPPHHPSKEIHLHIHNGGHHDEHVPISPSAWSREGLTADPKTSYVYEPYRAGPQTISTPYGNYVKVDSSPLTALSS